MPEAPSAAPAAARRPQAKAGGGGHNITVAVRVRPLNAKEVQRNSWSCLSLQEGRQINVADPDDKMGGVDYLRLDKTKDKSYAFDHALDESMSQEDVFRCTTQGLLPGLLLGYNSCVFAYGATGSGKTFTMAGSLEQPGVIPLTLAALFAACAEAEDEYSTLLRMQYVEIYNEQIQDLLEPSSVSLDVREDPKRGTFVAGATSRVVTSRAELERLLHKANLYRTTDATNCNEVSSRSHAVLQLQLETTARFGEVAEVRTGKLSMIDLAGSERQGKTQNAGKKLVEGANINRSLLALGNCINALADKSKRGGHIPYRDSKLTRLLKDSLGGACKTVMIANVSPASDQFDETLNSLKCAARYPYLLPSHHP
jgi:kinesin family protein 18/19